MFVPMILVLLAPLPGSAQDTARGKEVNGPCAGCHGEYGQGGKRGEYPRIGGQRAAYLEEQLISFKSRRRHNMPMFPYTQERELSDEDIADVSAYLASLKLPTRPPTFKPTDDALTRLLAMEKVMIVPRVEGNIDNGRDIYQSECANCHGKTGMGRSNFPMLVGQYTSYLMKQMEAYVKGERPHDEDLPAKGVLMPLKPADLQDILAYLTSIQDAE